jgi:hypothetical protein
MYTKFKFFYCMRWFNKTTALKFLSVCGDL